LLGKSVPDWEDVLFVYKPVLRHRIVLTFSAEAEGISADHLLEKLAEKLDSK
jgi:MoxR-like ATPase